MLRGRLFLRYYMIIAYFGVLAGSLISLESESDMQLGTAFFLLFVGMIFHFMRGSFGFYISISINSIGLGFVSSFLMNSFDMSMNPNHIILSVAILLFVFIALTYIASLKFSRNVGYSVSILLVIAIYIFIFVSYGKGSFELFGNLFILQHIGVLFMIAMFVTKTNTELLLRNCSVASFSLLAVAIIAGLLVLLAKSDGDIDFDFGSGKKTSRTRSYHHHHHHHSSDLLWYASMNNNSRTRQYNRTENYPNEGHEFEDVYDKERREAKQKKEQEAIEKRQAKA